MIINYIHWNIDPEIFKILGISLRYYGVLFVGGLILCIYILNWIFKNENIPLVNFLKWHVTLSVCSVRDFVATSLSTVTAFASER
jgi:prolipoprotein diacylglyceryltransferase